MFWEGGVANMYLLAKWGGVGGALLRLEERAEGETRGLMRVRAVLPFPRDLSVTGVQPESVSVARRCLDLEREREAEDWAEAIEEAEEGLEEGLVNVKG